MANLMLRETCRRHSYVNIRDISASSTNHMTETPSGEACSSSAGQELRLLLWNRKVYHHIHKNLPPDPILSHLNPVHTLAHSFSLRSISVWTSHQRLGPQKWSPPFVSLPKLCMPSYLRHAYYMPSTPRPFLFKGKVVSVWFFNWAPRPEGVLG